RWSSGRRSGACSGSAASRCLLSSRSSSPLRAPGTLELSCEPSATINHAAGLREPLNLGCRRITSVPRDTVVAALYLTGCMLLLEQTIADAGGRFRRKSGDFCTINTLIGYPTSARSDRNGSGIGAADVQKGEFDETPLGVHANRAARRDRHHRHPGRHPLS